MEWYLKVLRQYSDFNGRARRQEYWMFVLFNLLITIVTLSIDGLLYYLLDGSWFPFLTIIYGLGILIPNIAVVVRRLHDVGKSGWMYFVGLIPLVGPIWLLVLYCTDSEYGENQYGPNPKGFGNNDEIDLIAAE